MPIRNPQSAIRNASTLTEVLISLMIMSIGIISLATLFPLSVLRTIKATQLTQGTDLRYNAESLIATRPQFFSDPDLNPLTIHNALPVFPVASPFFLTSTLDRYVIDPLGYNFVRQRRVQLGLPAGMPLPFLPTPSLPALEDRYGNLNGTPLVATARRYGVGLTALPAVPTPDFFPSADYFVTLPDSWVTQYEDEGLNAVVYGTTAAGFTQLDVLNMQADYLPIGFVMAPNVSYRAVIFSADGSSSQVRTLTQYIGGGTDGRIRWTEDINGNGVLDAGDVDPNNNGGLDTHALPLNFVPGKVRIEAQERRYTWMLTCRQLGVDSAEVDAVIFFGRKFEDVTEDEALYQASFTAGSPNVLVAYPAGASAPAGARRGGYVFDADNARWYRISNVVDLAPGSLRVDLETPVVTTSPPGPPLGSALPVGGGHAMFPRTVIDVYPLGQKP